MADYATLLRDHVTLKCRSIDRIFLQAYVAKLQSVGQVCRFLCWQRGFKIPSSAAFGKIGDAYVKAIHQYADEHKIPIVHFEKGHIRTATSPAGAVRTIHPPRRRPRQTAEPRARITRP